MYFVWIKAANRFTIYFHKICTTFYFRCSFSFETAQNAAEINLFINIRFIRPILWKLSSFLLQEYTKLFPKNGQTFWYGIHNAQYIFFESYYLFKIGCIKRNTAFGTIKQRMNKFYFVIYLIVFQHLG